VENSKKEDENLFLINKSQMDIFGKEYNNSIKTCVRYNRIVTKVDVSTPNKAKVFTKDG